MLLAKPYPIAQQPKIVLLNIHHVFTKQKPPLTIKVLISHQDFN